MNTYKLKIIILNTEDFISFLQQNNITILTEQSLDFINRNFSFKIDYVLIS